MALRLYSGFENSLNVGVWQPEGLPSMGKWITTIDSEYDLRLLFMAKDSGTTYISQWMHRRDTEISIAGFRNRIFVISGIRYFRGIFPRKIAMVLREFRQAAHLVWACKRLRPDLVYLDSANVLLGATISRIFPNVPIVIRVLGVCSWWWSIIDSKRWIDKLYRYVYRSTSFSLVVATQDGSGAEFWLQKVLPDSTPRATLLNGVDSHKLAEDAYTRHHIEPLRSLKARDTKIILFVGRLESYKGVELFLSEMIDLIGNSDRSLHVVLIGSGNMTAYTKNRVSEAKLQKMFSILGSIPHKYIMNYHDISDIYVSTNTDGNLTNANLEAIANNSCILIPRPLRNDHVDRQTYVYLQDSVCYYDFYTSGSLAATIKNLIQNPENITLYKERIKKEKVKFVRTWKERFDEERRMIEGVIRNNQRRLN